MNLLLSLIKSLELFLTLKNKLFYYEIRTKSLSKQEAIIKQIEILRDRGKSGDADAADLLRMELKRERQELEHLSAFYFEASKKSANSDS
jgi:hypothetical protein